MTDFRFASPDWMYATWVVLAIAGLLVYLEWRGQSVLDQFVSKIMQTRLSHRVSLTRRLVTIAFLTITMLLFVVTMMQPQWGRTTLSTTRVESQMMICLDVSKSMLAEDVAPSRLERAKVELDSLLGLMNDGQQVGLIGFAGKATVMCPMTTDFGFLRLILGEARPQSVGLGGTKIGDAIRKAVDGFGEAGDVNRLIMVLTDGEDHDSFPLEVAATAREKGIKIISIGFGDEAGSKIEITNPKTGARTFLKDRNGNDVISRLDGATLRDLALETEGAYIPAGTGALDLESIYEAHIKSLLSGSTQREERIVRNEAFQWPLMGGIVTFLFGVFVSAPYRLRERAAAASQMILPAGKSVCFALAIGIVSTASYSLAQQPPPDTAPGAAEPTPSNQKDNVKDGSSQTNSPPSIPEEIKPRQAYNQSLSFVHSDPDRAEKFLNRARRDAGVDGEVRFRSLFSLGWVEANRADRLLEQDPQKALGHLHQAANRFREAIRVRPKNDDARHNLEIVSRRILELADSLNQKDPRDLAARLDELIQQIRSHQSEIRTLAQTTKPIESSQMGAGHLSNLRTSFRNLGVTQRQVISDIQKFADDARQQLDGIQIKKPEEQTDEEKVKTIQIENMLVYIDSGLQRMNKARSLTRRLQAVRGFQRWSAALTDTKRARDQLRNPVEIIGQIIGDASELKQLTQIFNAAKSNLSGDSNGNRAALNWLTNEYLFETQTAVEQRTNELTQILRQTVDAQTAQPNEDISSQSSPDQLDTQRLLQNIRDCLPLLVSAANDFGIANEMFTNSSMTEAIEKQSVAINSLNEAWELFFDIRRLVEVMYRDQQTINGGLQSAVNQPASVYQIVDEIQIREQKNIDRCQRLEDLLNEELDKTNQPVATETPANPTGKNTDESKSLAAEKQRLDLAKTILVRISDHMRDVKKSAEKISRLEAPEGVETRDDSIPDSPTQDEEAKSSEDLPEKPDRDSNGESTEFDRELEFAEQRSTQAIDDLEELRRLFFSLVEHLRETAGRQSNLNDETQAQSVDIETETVANLEKRLGPLSTRQQQLKTISKELAKAFANQSEQSNNSSGQPSSGGNLTAQTGATNDADKLKEASQLVENAAKDMESTIQEFSEIFVPTIDRSQQSEKDLPSHRQHLDASIEAQQSALNNLAKALELLDQKQDQNQNQDQSQDQDQNKSDQNEQEQRQQQMNAQQLLQLIRDREAERRKNKQKRAVGQGTVDKDW